MRFSKSFSLSEFLISQTAERNGISMTPSEEVIDNIRALVIGLLQPLRDEVNTAIFISSGFRPLELNTRIGGSKTSAHLTGSAADFRVSGQTPFQTCELIVAMGLPYDTVINEFQQWTHLATADILRGRQMTAKRIDGKTRYVKGILE